MTKKALLTAGAVLALGTGLPGGQAWATPTCTAGTTIIPGGTTSGLPLSDFENNHCVLSQDKLFGDLTPITALPTGATVNLALSTISGLFIHTFSIGGSFVPATYEFSFQVHDTSGPQITALDSDFTQSALAGATSTLTKTTTPTGTPPAIHEVKVGNTKTAGSITTMSYNFVDNLAITDTLVARGDVSSIENDVVETPTPEPASMVLLGTGLVGLGYWRRRNRKR